ncbi:MAG: undecaprenyldiphospho-muramoylpentapeptide beta-N-acetylglucosaminyltransferase [Pseudomonadota bacterium]
MTGSPVIALTAGGTGGHLFPAEALAAELKDRGTTVHLITDARGREYASVFEGDAIHVVQSETLRRKSIGGMFAMIRTIIGGVGESRQILRTVGANSLVAFGGYPTVPPGFAAASLKLPLILHEQNAVIGRANRMLASRASKIATCFDSVSKLNAPTKVTVTGNPVRPSVLDARTPYDVPTTEGPLKLLVFGGSQGARFFSDAMPDILAKLPENVRSRLVLTQQCRPEDMARVERAYADLGISADLSPFFTDLPQRLSASHLIIGRAGASTVSELAVLGRPSILIPLPGSLDQDQMANAKRLETAGGAIAVPQVDFTPEFAAKTIADLFEAPDRLAAMADGALSAGKPDAVQALADLVMAHAI